MVFDFYTNHPWFLYAFIALFSLCVGSLLNVVIYRLPIMIKSEWHHQCSQLLNVEEKPAFHKINLFWPRSFCPQCKVTIKAWQNIPILSYCYLWGGCNNCKEKIPIRYPLIELATLVLSLFACWHFGLSKQLIVALPTLWILIAIFFIDIDEQLIPDSLSLSLLWLGLLANTVHVFTSLTDAVYSAAGGYLSVYLFIQLFYLLTGKIGMGNGDFKLFAAFGALLGVQFLPLILFLAAAIGCIIGLMLLRLNNKPKDTPIAFGPYLCISGLVSLFWGQEIYNWYFSAFGLNFN